MDNIEIMNFCETCGSVKTSRDSLEREQNRRLKAKWENKLTLINHDKEYIKKLNVRLNNEGVRDPYDQKILEDRHKNLTAQMHEHIIEANVLAVQVRMADVRVEDIFIEIIKKDYLPLEDFKNVFREAGSERERRIREATRMTQEGQADEG